MHERFCFILVCCFAVAGGSLLGSRTDREESDSVLSATDRIGRGERDAQKQAVESVLADRKDLVEALCAVVDQKNAGTYSWEARVAGAYLLGELRAPEAVPSLSSAMVEVLREGSKVVRGLAPPYRSPLAVSNALIKIGRPAVPQMIENIEGSDDKTLVIGSLQVLNRAVGGKRHVLEVLSKLKARAKDEKKIERVEGALKYVREHFTEDEEPLY